MFIFRKWSANLSAIDQNIKIIYFPVSRTSAAGYWEKYCARISRVTSAFTCHCGDTQSRDVPSFLATTEAPDRDDPAKTISIQNRWLPRRPLPHPQRGHQPKCHAGRNCPHGRHTHKVRPRCVAEEFPRYTA